ncbi:ComF family protein [Pseudoxanthomonas sp. Root630]|uniref:ComF family protein n=1 Tax=Pseudoxanthomonas sp. Root630 TaxID=1736574 RepID=UPI000702C5EE|nr:ComF family protein [Pseudoxanthomonas sp. Root630]KRA41488.1 competence protein ComF [Pseudoxanthomonas sp. Root630]
MDAGLVDKWRTACRWLLPPRCVICRESGAYGFDLCLNCTQSLPWNHAACMRCGLPLPVPGECGACLTTPPPVTTTAAAFVYGFPIDRLVPRFKFHQDLAAGRLLAELAAGPLGQAPRPEALIPIPLHASRLRERGYDQALELARPLARSLSMSLVADRLVRQRATAAQSELHADARQRNVARAFGAVGRGPLPRHVALLDDVMTTGATLHAAARTLLAAGVTRVDAWVIARVP